MLRSSNAEFLHKAPPFFSVFGNAFIRRGKFEVARQLGALVPCLGVFELGIIEVEGYEIRRPFMSRRQQHRRRRCDVTMPTQTEEISLLRNASFSKSVKKMLIFLVL